MATMLYDADCGFCTATAARVPLLGVDVEIAPVQGGDLAALGIDSERALVEMPFVHDDGRISYGHQAWAAILATGPAPCRLLGRALGSRPLRPLAAALYRWVSQNRPRLPGGTSACAIDQRRP